MSAEIALPKGDVTEGVVRVGDTVRRPHTDISARVAAYLDHLHRRGFERVPRALGRDDRGRDVLTFLDGDVAGDHDTAAWAGDDEVLAPLGALVRALHDASADYRPDEPIQPRADGRPRPAFPPDERIVAQRDVTPGNTVFRDGRPWGLIDFDLSDWTTRSLDLANTALHWVPLCDPLDRSPAFAGGDPGPRLRLLLDGYGRDAVSADLLLSACELRFAGSYATMRWNAEHLGGGWQRMWDAGVGEVIRRRVSWFTSARPGLAVALAQ